MRLRPFQQVIPVSRREIPKLILLGIVQAGSEIVRVRDFEGQLQTIIGKRSEDPLVRKYFEFKPTDEGVYSFDLRSALSTLTIEGYIENVGRFGDKQILADRVIHYIELVLPNRDISESQVNFWRRIGEEVEIKERYKIVNHL